MPAQPVDIKIFGRLLRVNCPPEQLEALTLAAEELDKRLYELRERTGVNNTEQLVFITALNICHELTQERLNNKDATLTIEGRLQCLLHTVEQALLQQNQRSYRQDVLFE